ncbi:MAG: TldD/PmbA family protein [Caldisphaeraceae archaeon]|nr:TldD/PmbA family protein [Caldisphaeraceae archaeon]
MVSFDNFLGKIKGMNAEAEVFHAKVRSYELSYSKKEKSFLRGEEEGYGLRLIKDKRLGFSYGNSLGDELLEMALSSSKANEVDEFNSLPSPEKVERVEVFDSRLVDPVSYLKDFVEQLSVLEDAVNVLSIRAVGGYSEIEVKNTQGVDVSTRSSFLWLGVSANYKGDEITPEVYEMASSRSLSNVNVKRLINDTREKVEVMKKRRKLSKRVGEVVFTQKALNELLAPMITHGFSLESYKRGATPFEQGQFFASRVSVRDDPLIPYSAWSREFDGEGLPSMRTQLIEEGVVKSYLSDSYWARKAGVKGTHSAYRTYRTLPSISTSNIVLEGNSFKESNELYIDQLEGVHTSNFVTGEFSVSANVAWDGEGGYREIVVSGNVKDLIEGIVGFSKDLMQYGKIVSGKALVKGLSLI